MSYQHPSGRPSSLTSPEFSAPSLAPFFCAYRGDSSEATPDVRLELTFAREFMETVLLRLNGEKWERVPAESVDLTTDEGSSSQAVASAANQPQPAWLEKLTVYNLIIAQLDAIMRHPDKDKHFPVEIS